jgi:hypothetical protein
VDGNGYILWRKINLKWFDGVWKGDIILVQWLGNFFVFGKKEIWPEIKTKKISN